MKLIVSCLLVVMHFSGYCDGGGGGKGSKHDLLKIHVPEIVKHQHHTHYVFIHKHAPKKGKQSKPAKKKEVKHHHHKHIHLPQIGHGGGFFGVHAAYGHKHTNSHGPPATKHHMVHKIVVHPPHSHGHHKHVAHKGHPHIPKAHPHHGYKVHPEGHIHKPKSIHEHVSHSHTSYPYSHDEGYDPAPAISPPHSISSGYEVTEDTYDPESEVYSGVSGGSNYGIPGEYSGQHGGEEQEDIGDYGQESDVEKAYHPTFFNYPQTGGSNSYAEPGHSGLSSYDISPYHQVSSHAAQPAMVHSIPNNADEGQEHHSFMAQINNGDQPQYSPAYGGDYESEQHNYDYEPGAKNDFKFQHNGYSDVSHVGHDSDEFGENVPGYSHHHKQFLNEINHGIRTNVYDARTFNAGNDGAPIQGTQSEAGGFQHGHSTHL